MPITNLNFNRYVRPNVQPAKYIQNLRSTYKAGNTVPVDYLLNDRKLTKEAIRFFKIGLSDDGMITMPVFKDSELIDYKMRSIPPAEKMFRRFPGSETWAFNWDSGIANAEKTEYLIVVEGEIDAISLWILGFQNVISIASGAQGPTPWVIQLPEDIKVYLCFDQDEPGQEAAKEIADRIGIEKCFNIVLPYKDANEFLVHGGIASDFQKLVNDAEKFQIKDVYKIADVIQQLKDNKIERTKTFSNRLNYYTNGGIPAKSLVVISGETGIGKSTALTNLLVHHSNNNIPVLLVSLENDLMFTIQRILEIKNNKTYDQFTEEDWVKITSEIQEYPFYLDISMDTHSMSKVSKVIEQAKKTLGIKIFAFDHIGFVPHRDDVKEMAQMVREFKLLARKHDIIIYLISHVNRGEGEFLDVNRLKGTSALGQDADLVWFIIGTKEGHEISIDKARMSRSKIRIPISFNDITGTMSDDNTRSVKHYNEEIEGPVTENISLDY